MKVIIIGAGFTGLAAAHKLSQLGHQVKIIEVGDKPGGLAAGFKAPHWSWELDYHYHHLFQTDQDIAQLLVDCGLRQNLYFGPVKTSILRRGKQFVFDSPISLLKAPILDLWSKMRVGATLAFLKFSPIWQPLEKITAHHFLRQTMGENAYKELWQPLFAGKFGRYKETINAAWFWARIHTRTSQLGYYQGGFGQMTRDIAQYLQKNKVQILYKTPVKKIQQNRQEQVEITTQKGQKIMADNVLVTLPSPVLLKLMPDLSNQYKNQLAQLKSLAAVTMVIELTQPFFADETYWLNINEDKWPFLAVVEHTQFQDKAHYGNHTILYVGKYLDQTDKQYAMSDQALFKLYDPYLQKLSPEYDRYIKKIYVFHSAFAQPVVEVNHSQILPSVHTPYSSVYWSSMQHIYPYDRGTNYAVRLGNKVATMIHEENQKS